MKLLTQRLWRPKPPTKSNASAKSGQNCGKRWKRLLMGAFGMTKTQKARLLGLHMMQA